MICVMVQAWGVQGPGVYGEISMCHSVTSTQTSASAREAHEEAGSFQLNQSSIKEVSGQREG